MNTFHNKRRQNTIKNIEDAFFTYLKDRELSQIKVSDICKKANINRSTFYANYIDIYDLADKILNRLEQEVMHLLEQDSAWNLSDKDFLRLFEHMQNNQTLYHFYFKLGYDHRSNLKLFDLCMQDHPFDTTYLDYHIAFFKSGFNAMVKMWLDRGCKESPQQMKELLLREYSGRIITSKN